LPIFGERNGGFLKNQCYDHNFAKTNSSLSKKRKIFRRKYFLNRSIGPRDSLVYVFLSFHSSAKSHY
jgi:hypothetical protein